MLKRWVAILKNLRQNTSCFDPGSLQDPVALQTEWTPARRGGASFTTHRLLRIDSGRMEFKSSMGAKLFYLFFLVIGAIIPLVFLYGGQGGFRFSWQTDTVLPLGVFFLFFCVGGGLLYCGTRPIVFDKGKGLFWKGWKTPQGPAACQEQKQCLALHSIHALQLLAEYCAGNKRSYYSYELNLVLANGQRLNVVDHGSYSKLKTDAATLAVFLDKPLWDAVATSGQ